MSNCSIGVPQSTPWRLKDGIQPVLAPKMTGETRSSPNAKDAATPNMKALFCSTLGSSRSCSLPSVSSRGTRASG